MCNFSAAELILIVVRGVHKGAPLSAFFFGFFVLKSGRNLYIYRNPRIMVRNICSIIKKKGGENMKKLLVLALVVVLMSSIALADVSVAVKRTNPGVAEKQRRSLSLTL